MSMNFTKILQQTIETESLVRVYRRFAPTVPICGYVAAVNEELLAIHKVQANVRFDGIVVVRTPDIGEVRTRGDDENFAKRALAARGLDMPTIPVDISSWKSVIESTKESSPVVAFQSIIDIDDADCHLTSLTYGSVVASRKESIRIRPIDLGGVWQEREIEIPCEDLCRIDCAGVFERLLGELAREPNLELDTE